MTNDTKKASTKTARLPLIALAALPLSLGLVFAQTTPQRVQAAQPGQTQPGQTQQSQTQNGKTQQSDTNYADVFLKNLAAQLGVSTDKLKAAATAASTATINQGVKAGDFDSNMATNMKQNVANDPFMMAGGHGGHGRGGHGGDFGGRGGPDDGRFGGMNGGPQGQNGQGQNGQRQNGQQPGQQGNQQGSPRMGGMGRGTVTAAIAKALGLDEQTLFQQLQSGKTIAEIAKAKGVSTAALHTAAVNALKTDLAAAVTAGRLTQTQADQMIQQAQADATFGTQFGGRGGRGQGGMRGQPTGQTSTTTDSAAGTGI